MPVPFYIFTGFLDSGKTSLIKETLEDAQFMEGIRRTLIISFEQGEVELDEKFLDEHNTFIEFLDSSVQLTIEKEHELDTLYHPDQIFIEYNGTEAMSEFASRPVWENWVLVEILSTVDASTFPAYVQNMRSMIFEQLRYSDVIICNRCDEKTSKAMLRGNIKAINSRAQIVYENYNHETMELSDEDLPFDINAPVIDITDDDYGLWYMDALDHPDKYDGKKIIIRGMYAEPIEGYKHSFILGRRAMVCCEQDTSLVGLTVTGVKVEEMHLNEWVEVEGTLKTVDTSSGQKTVVLYASRLARYQAPENEYVNFN